MALPVSRSVDESSIYSLGILLTTELDQDLQVFVDACKEADTTAVIEAIKRLHSRANVNTQSYRFCLRDAVLSGNAFAVQELLASDVPIEKGAIDAALEKKSYLMLSLFLTHGWDINKEMGSWRAPPLA